jgi:hypothetical protein
MESRNLCWRQIFVAVIEILQGPRFSDSAVTVFPFPRRLEPSVLYAVLPTHSTASIISSAYIISSLCDVFRNVIPGAVTLLDTQIRDVYNTNSEILLWDMKQFRKRV